MSIGVFAQDPGGATGLAWGIFDPHHPEGVGGAIRNRTHSGSATVTGDERTQIREIADLWQSFYSACVRSANLGQEDVWFVSEDFIYSPGVNYEGDSAKISTALIWGVEGYRMGQYDAKRGKSSRMPPLILQTASNASTSTPNDRLKEYGAWIVGRDHERSAFRHVALFLKRYAQQYSA